MQVSGRLQWMGTWIGSSSWSRRALTPTWGTRLDTQLWWVCSEDVWLKVLQWPHVSKLLLICVYLSTMQVAVVIALYASSFLRPVLVHLPRHPAVLHHSIDHLTAAASMLSDSCCTTGQIQWSVMTMVHPLYIRYRAVDIIKTFEEDGLVVILPPACICCSVKRLSRLQSRAMKRCVSCFWSAVQPSAARWTRGSSFPSSWHRSKICGNC